MGGFIDLIALATPYISTGDFGSFCQICEPSVGFAVQQDDVVIRRYHPL